MTSVILAVLAQTPGPTVTDVATTSDGGPVWWVILVLNAGISLAVGYLGGLLAFRRSRAAERTDRRRDRIEAHHTALGQLIDAVQGLETAVRFGVDAPDLLDVLLERGSAAYRDTNEMTPVHERLVAFFSGARDDEVRDELLVTLAAWRRQLREVQTRVAIRREPVDR